MSDHTKDNAASRYKFTLYNSHPLLDEIHRRMPDNLSGAITDAQIDGIGFERYGADWPSEYTSFVRQGHYATTMRYSPGTPATADVVEFLACANKVAEVLEELQLIRKAECDGVRETVLRELRIGNLIAACRGPEGFLPPLAASVWHGSSAEVWLVTGTKDQLEVYVGNPVELGPWPHGAFAEACRKAFHGGAPNKQRRILEWLANEYPDAPPKAYTGEMYTSMENAGINVAESTLTRAYRAAKKIYDCELQ